MSHEPLPISESLTAAPPVTVVAAPRSRAAEWAICLGVGLVTGLVMCAADGHKVTGHKSLLLMTAMMLCSHWSRSRGTLAGSAWTAIGTFRLVMGGGGSIYTVGFAGLLAELLRPQLTGQGNLWLRSVLGGLLCATGYVFKILFIPTPEPNQVMGLSGHFLWGALGVLAGGYLVHRFAKSRP